MSYTNLSPYTPSPNEPKREEYFYEPVASTQPAPAPMPALLHHRTNSVAVDIAPAPYQLAFKSLWIEQIFAVIAGLITLVIGVFGLTAALAEGPFSTMFIHPNIFKGHIINTSNIGALVAAAATAMASVGQKIVAGVSRAWLRRQTIRGEGVTIKQWKTLSSGIAIKAVRKTPFLACGVILAFTIAMAIHGSALAGVIIPASAYITVFDTYGPVVSYLNNGGIGQLNDCLDNSQLVACLVYNSIPYISEAFFSYQATNNSTGQYQLGYDQIYSSSGFMAAVPILIAAGASELGVQPDFVSATVDTPVSMFESNCSVSKTGIYQGFFTVDSYCTGETMYYGNTSAADGNYIWGSACRVDDEVTYVVEIAVGGGRYGDVNDNSTFGVLCNVKGWEGKGTDVFVLGLSTTITSNFSDFHPLSNLDMISMGSGFVEAMRSEAGLGGVAGSIGLGMELSTRPDNVVHPKAVADRLSNAWAAAAAVGYGQLAGRSLLNTTTGGMLYPYNNVAENERFDWRLQGYGWPASTRLLGWSVLCVLVSLAWFATAGYMIGGGTQYDPTNWFQTVNTSAGSSISQQPGTCTGANVRAKDIDNRILWYGELGSDHVGFAQSPIPAIRKGQLYGATKMKTCAQCACQA